MKIKYVTEDDLNFIKKNLEQIYCKVIKNNECTLAELLGKDKLFKDTSLSVEQFQLDVSQPKERAALTDAENVQRVYNHMRNLSYSQASDERLWAAYTLFEFFDYMKYRWVVGNAVDVNNKYLFGYSKHRSLFKNGIARLWWIGRLTYDETRNDPYELTKFLCRDQTFVEDICSRNIFNNSKITLAVLSALVDAEKNGMPINYLKVGEVCKYVNLLAGTYILDVLDKEDIYAKVRRKLGF